MESRQAERRTERTESPVEHQPLTVRSIFVPVMDRPRPSGLLPLLGFGVLAFLVACLSILDMFLPRPNDGVIRDTDREELVVRAVVSGSGGDAAGIRAGDRIVGLGRVIVRGPSEAARVLQQKSIGEQVPYLVERGGTVLELDVTLGPRRLGTPRYYYYCFSGFLFFFIGLFVLLHHPGGTPGAPSRVFFALCTLFLLFLVCHLRPASYSWVDGVVLTTGTLSLLVLPASFLHFFIVFPRRLRVTLLDPAEDWDGSSGQWLRSVERFINDSANLFRVLYLLPPLFYVLTLAVGTLFQFSLRLVSGAPISSWVLMADYFVLGLLALLASLLRAQDGRERRQIATVFSGTVLGIAPFLVFGVVFSSLGTDQYLFWGIVPLILVPLTFAYAIVRFQFFNIRVIIRRSLLYTLTTAVVSAGYALGIATFNLLFRDFVDGRSPFFFLFLALAILALFDPLRRRLQGPIDRFFFREVYDARRAVEEVSEAVAREFSFERLEELLATRLSEIMHLEWAALFVNQGKDFVSSTAPVGLASGLPGDLLLVSELCRQSEPVRLAMLEPIKALDPASRRALEALVVAGARLLVPLKSREQLHAILALGPKRSEEEFGRDDLQLIRTLANQGAVALENAKLLVQRTKQLELEKELEIARRVQFSLIPAELPSPAGWQVAARCVPARQVGGDFYDSLPGIGDGSVAYVVGDVSGKSVAGAMLMVAAREILHTAALHETSPNHLLQVANQRLYTPQHRLFVALLYLLLEPGGRGTYALAGQPPPLLCRVDGRVEEVPSTQHRLPIGALRDGAWDLLSFNLRPGDLVLLYSDGLTDARRADGEAFGEQRLLDALSRQRGEPEQVVDSVLSAVGEFSEGTDPFDDITVLAARWLGEPEC